MTELSFHFVFPKFVSSTFTGNVNITCAFPTEGYHRVAIEYSEDGKEWALLRSTIINQVGTYAFTYAETGKQYRLTTKDKPDSVTTEPIEDTASSTTPNSETTAEKVKLTAIAGLLATQVQAAITELLAKIIALGAAISYEGQVTTFASLPTKDLKKGMMYNVVEANGKILAGTNYVWNGNEWDPMVGQIDLTPFLKATDAASTYVPLKATETATGSDVVRLLAVNSKGQAISITPKVIVDYAMQSLLDYHVLAISK